MCHALRKFTYLRKGRKTKPVTLITLIFFSCRGNLWKNSSSSTLQSGPMIKIWGSMPHWHSPFWAVSNFYVKCQIPIHSVATERVMHIYWKFLWCVFSLWSYYQILKTSWWLGIFQINCHLSTIDPFTSSGFAFYL